MLEAKQAIFTPYGGGLLPPPKLGCMACSGWTKAQNRTIWLAPNKKWSVFFLQPLLDLRQVIVRCV